MQSELGLYLIKTRGDLGSPEGAHDLSLIQSGGGFPSTYLYQLQVQAHIRVPRVRQSLTC